jgi:hypothetical protein
VIFFIQSIFLQGFRRAAALDCLGCDFFCLRFDCHINKHPIYPGGIKAILCRIRFPQGCRRAAALDCLGRDFFV